VLASRAVTSAFAAMLRSRRVRDLAAVVLALVAASIGPAQLVLGSFASHATLGPALRLARILGWTPLAAGFVAPFDVADGRPLLAVARLLIVAGTCVVLIWWWSLTLESAMIGGSASGPARSRADHGGPVATLLPRVLHAARPGRFTAIVGRELRYWSRDPRRRAGLISIMVGGAVVPIALRVVPGSHGKEGAPLPVAVAFSSVAGAAILANQFGFDGSAYAAHLLAAVPGRTELRARATALALIMLPVVTVLTVIVALVSRDAGALPATLGTVGAMFGASMGMSSVISVLAAFPVPESRNAFASGGGSGGAKGLLSLAGMVGAVAGSAPVLVGALLLHGTVSWLLAPVGVAWGLAAVLLATYIIGDVLDRRGPELLVAVTPRR
jgi:ABC-2 type transport system permease protein